MNLIENIDGVVQVPSHNNYGFYEGAVRGFCTRSISENKSGATMMRYGINEVFTLSYEAESQKFSLTLCIGKGELSFRQFDIIEFIYKRGHDGNSIAVSEIVKRVSSFG